MPYEETLAAFRRGHDDDAARLASRDVAAARASGDLPACVDGLCMLARVALRRGDLAEVTARAEEAQLLARESGVERLERMPLHLRAVAARMSGDFDEGRRLYLESIAVNEAVGEATMAAAEHRNLAYLEIRAGNAERARELFAESIARFQNVHAPTMAPYLTFDQAAVAAMDGDHVTAAGLLAAAQRQWDEQGLVPDPDDAAEIAELRGRLAATGHTNIE